MYRMILVPLDGSDLAEIVLPHVEMLAKAGAQPAEVVLLEVVEPARAIVAGYGDGMGQAAILAQQAAEAEREDAQKYLPEVEKRLKAKGLNVRSEIKTGNAGDEILDFAANNPVDLIAMASHGRSGIGRWAYGSIASKVLRGIDTPILVVTPEKK